MFKVRTYNKINKYYKIIKIIKKYKKNIYILSLNFTKKTKLIVIIIL